MKLDDLLELARRLAVTGVWQAADIEDAQKLAKGFVDKFGEAEPCGLIEPEVYPNEVIITREMVGRYEPDDAHAEGVALIRAAEKAREGV